MYMRLVFGVLILYVFLINNVMTFPIWDYRVQLTQPNGMEFECLLSGDEFWRCYHQGKYKIVQNPYTEYYMYSEWQGSSLVTTNIMAGILNEEEDDFFYNDASSGYIYPAPYSYGKQRLHYIELGVISNAVLLDHEMNELKSPIIENGKWYTYKVLVNNFNNEPIKVMCDLILDKKIESETLHFKTYILENKIASFSPEKPKEIVIKFNIDTEKIENGKYYLKLSFSSLKPEDEYIGDLKNIYQGQDNRSFVKYTAFIELFTSEEEKRKYQEKEKIQLEELKQILRDFQKKEK